MDTPVYLNQTNYILLLLFFCFFFFLGQKKGGGGGYKYYNINKLDSFEKKKKREMKSKTLFHNWQMPLSLLQEIGHLFYSISFQYNLIIYVFVVIIIMIL